jgi:hypothetical protein
VRRSARRKKVKEMQRSKEQRELKQTGGGKRERTAANVSVKGTRKRANFRNPLQLQIHPSAGAGTLFGRMGGV